MSYLRGGFGALGQFVTDSRREGLSLAWALIIAGVLAVVFVYVLVTLAMVVVLYGVILLTLAIGDMLFTLLKRMSLHHSVHT